MKTVKAKNRLNNNSKKQAARYHFAQRALFGCCVAFQGWDLTCRALLSSFFFVWSVCFESRDPSSL